MVMLDIERNGVRYCVKAPTMQEAVAELYGFATVAQPGEAEGIQ
jgi:hypothetical protein